MTLSAAEATVLAVIAAGVRPESAEQMGLHAECARIAKRLGPRLHYGPEVPSDDHQTQRLFTVLGVVSHRLMTGHQTRLRGVLSAVS
jgi:hypothetical protein